MKEKKKKKFKIELPSISSEKKSIIFFGREEKHESNIFGEEKKEFDVDKEFDINIYGKIIINFIFL